MKVLNVNISIDSSIYGGTAERTYQLTRFLNKNGIDCTLLILDFGKLSDEIKRNLCGIKIISFPCLIKRFYVPLVSFKKLKSIIQDVDIVHFIGHWTVLNALVYYYARKLKKPYVFCPAGALSIYGRSKLIKKIYNWIVGNKILNNASKYIAITQDEVSLFQQVGAKQQDISLIPNGIDEQELIPSERFQLLNKFNISNKKYLLFMGRLHFIKGPDLLLKAFAKIQNDFPDYHLVFAGFNDGLLQTLQKTVKTLNLQDRVHFIGHVAGQDKMQLYHHATLLVIPSRKEAMSIVVLESGILGKPVLITDQCGFPEVSDIEGGLVVPASVKGIEEGLRQLLKNQQTLLNMGEQLKKYIIENYTWDSQVAKLLHLYQKILQS